MIWFDDVLAKESIKSQYNVIVEYEFRSKWRYLRFRYYTISQQWIISANLELRLNVIKILRASNTYNAI